MSFPSSMPPASQRFLGHVLYVALFLYATGLFLLILAALLPFGVVEKPPRLEWGSVVSFRALGIVLMMPGLTLMEWTFRAMKLFERTKRTAWFRRG